MFQNTRNLVFLMVFLLGAFDATASRAQLISAFDTDEEGWSSVTGSPITYVGAGGNPGGFIELDNTAGRMDAHAPDKFLGDLTGYLGATLAFDVKNINGAATDFESFGRVDISNDPADAFADAVLGGLGQPLNDGLWHTYSIPLTSDLWSGDLEEALTSVDDIKVDLRPTLSGDAVIGFDNFRIIRPASVPEPGASALLLGIILVAGGRLLRSRRK